MENIHVSSKPKHVTPQIDCLLSIVKASTIKCQIYPNEVFYVKDLLPTRLTI